MSEDLFVYEIGFHLAPTLEEEGVFKVVTQIKKGLSSSGGELLSEENPKMIALSYEIGKFDKALFGWLKFQIAPSKIEAFKAFMEGQKEIIRFLIVKTDKENNIHYHKISMPKKEEMREVKEAEMHEEAKKTSVEEIDKSIEELIIA